ncbi:hypothetical protein MRX96_027152 [Rhipicephalus microplus]
MSLCYCGLPRGKRAGRGNTSKAKAAKWLTKDVSARGVFMAPERIPSRDNRVWRHSAVAFTRRLFLVLADDGVEVPGRDTRRRLALPLVGRSRKCPEIDARLILARAASLALYRELGVSHVLILR